MKRCRAVVVALTVATIVGLPGLAAAQSDGPDSVLPEFFEGVRPAGAGGAHTAVTSGVDSLYQNPAGTARAPMYVLDAGFEYTPQGAMMNAGIVDSKINPQLAAGLGYTYFVGRGDHDSLSGHDARVAVGIPVVPEQISVGAGLRWLRITDEDIPETEDDDQLLIDGFTGDVGVNIQPSEMLHLGLKGENLIDHCADDDRCRGSTPTRVGGGVGVGDETTFLLSADAAADLTSSPEGPVFDFGVGLEYLAGAAVPLRAGFKRRAYLDRNMLTFGGGWRSEDVGLDLAYRHDLNDAGQFGYMSANFSVYF